MSCRGSWPAPATRPRSAAGPVPTLCAGSRFRPLAVGYVRPWPSDPPEHAEALPARLCMFAHARGLALADVFTEPADMPASRAGAAFSALVEALRRPHITTVIIPAEHFARLAGLHRAMCTAIAVQTGADVLIMSAGP
jgi:hypothetical protein